MSLLRLPPETLKQIFDQLDSSFFHEDLGRLTVCKQWFDFALPECLKNITLSQETLRNLVISQPTSAKPSPLEKSLETLNLNLGVYQDNISPPSPREPTASNKALRDKSVKTWTKALNDDLAHLAIVVQKSHRLRELRISTCGSLLSNPLSSPEDYLSLSTMRAFLSVENLSVLVLDLPGTSLDSSGERGDECHICPSIAALLPTLRTLHLRMRTICPDVLKVQDPSSTWKLGTVIINFVLLTDQLSMMAATHSKPCDSHGGGLIQLRVDIQEQAEALVTRMVSPKTMRILTQTLPQFDTMSLDVLTGKIMKLGDGAAWDEDGKTVQEDSEPESEISDGEFDGFLDD
ncbi:hypothetical protein FPHYL_9471 [Fusarium phyllophilum]|uniref:F-box domain-containing protein n=1 Tax=Fusarium phyllophilum TaxID=47803 RepID=A0A8H5N2U3_9HYPO|nr:hypothetical protein FPHYL_9471 [Fusarium phyllophilum]